MVGRVCAEARGAVVRGEKGLDSRRGRSSEGRRGPGTPASSMFLGQTCRVWVCRFFICLFVYVSVLLFFLRTFTLSVSLSARACVCVCAGACVRACVCLSVCARARSCVLLSPCVCVCVLSLIHISEPTRLA